MGLNSNIKMINSTACHCCSLDVFENILKDKAIRLCDMRNTNDPKEVIAASEYILKIINERYLKTENEKYILLKSRFINDLKSFNPYVVSFTNIINETIFDRYAKNGEGIGINFHSSNFGIGVYIVNDHKDIYYVPVFYEPKGCEEFANTIIDSYINDEIKLENATLELMKVSCMYKTKEWKEEKEIRIYYIPSSKNLLGEKHFFKKLGKDRSYYKLLFNQFDKKNIIENIILGPNFKEENIKYVKELLIKYNFEEVNIYRFEEAYKESIKKLRYLGY